MKYIVSSIIFIVLISSSYFVTAQNIHSTHSEHSIPANSTYSNHSNHSTHQHSATANPLQAQPTETGQSAFAAIAEIVALLESDPATDWSSVNIDALREHLVDMNSLTLTAEVFKEITDKSAVFTITGSRDTQRAIKKMVPAHAQQLMLIKPWDVNTQIEDNGVTLTLTSNDNTELEKVDRLGFFGLMAIGAHHQAHHLAMALGKMQH